MLKVNVFVVGAALLVAACGHSKAGTKGEAYPTASGQNGNEPTRRRTVVKPGLEMLPAMPVVVGADLMAVKKSALWKLFGPMLKAEANQDADFRLFKEKCGYDPFNTLSEIWIAIDPDVENADGTPDGAIVATGLPAKKTWECVTRDNPSIKGDTYTQGDTSMTFVEPDALVAKLMGGEAGLEKILSGGGLTKSGAFTTLAKKVNTSDALWFVMTRPSKGLQRELQDMPVQLDVAQMYGSVDLKVGIVATLGLVAGSPQQADQLAMLAKMGLGQVDNAPLPPELKDAVKKIDIKTSGATLQARVALSESELLGVVGAALQAAKGP